MSSYDFTPSRSAGGGKPGLLGSSGFAAVKPPPKLDAPPPTRTVKVRAHTRTIKAKPAPTSAAAPANTQIVRPAQVSTVKRFVPNYPREPIAGYTAGLRNPDRSWAKPGGRAVPGAVLGERPYYTDASTMKQRAGPVGQASTQWNAAQVAQAKKIQIANYGKPGYILRSLVPGGLDEGGVQGPAQALTRGASIASTVLPGGGVGEAAGILGSLGLKGLRGFRAAKDVAEVAPKVVEAGKVAETVAPHISKGQDFAGGLVDKAREPGYLYHRAPAESFGKIRERGLRPSRPGAPGTTGVPVPAPAAGARSKEAILADPKSWTERDAGRFLTPDAAKELDAVTHVNVEGNLAAPTAERHPPGVYFGNEPVQAQGLSWKKGGVYFRVKRENVPGLTERAFGESHTPHSIPPSDVEYLGKDGAWHPVAAPRASLSPQEQAREGLRGARGLRARQEAGYSVERGSRAARIHAIYNDTTLSVAEREHAADAALRGALPKVYFGGFKDLTPDTLEQMKATVMAHPTLMSYDKKTVLKALNNAHAGEVPTNSELDKIETVFGKATRDSFAKYAKETSKWKDAFYEVGNIPRSMMAAVDVSGVGRQGLGALVNHPIITGRNLPGMMRAANHEAFFQQGMKNLAARPNAGKYEMGKLAVTNLEGIGNREEPFASNLAEKLTGLGKRERSPVRWSGRAYTYLLTHARADIYDHYDAQFAKAGYDVHDPKFIKGLSTMINSITGRGFSLGGLAHGTSGKALNTVLFSPNLMASRFDLLNPVYYAKMPKELRLLALRHSLATVGAIASTLELARLAGLHVGLDPRSADFAKIKVGNTRIDLAAGYQQTVRMLYQVAVGQSKSSSTGQVINLRSGKYGQKSVTDVLTNFFENKESPLAAITSDYVLRGGKNTIGQQMTPTRLAGNYLTPLLGQDLFDIYNEKHGGVNGLAWALGAAPLGALGVGLQTYGPKAPKARGGSSGGGSSYDFTPSGSGGGSSYDFTPAP